MFDYSNFYYFKIHLCKDNQNSKTLKIKNWKNLIKKGYLKLSNNYKMVFGVNMDLKKLWKISEILL